MKLDTELLNQYCACLGYARNIFIDQDPLDAPYTELFKKILHNIIGSLTLLQGIPHFEDFDLTPEAFILFRSTIESVVYLTYLCHFPNECQNYRDHSFIEQAKDIAKTIQYGFYDNMSHDKLKNEMEQIFNRTGKAIPKDKYLDFNTIGRISYFPNYRTCLKKILDADSDGLNEGVCITLYNWGSQLIHSNKISLGQFYSIEELEAKYIPTDQNKMLKDTLYLLLASTEALDLILPKKIKLPHSLQFNELLKSLDTLDKTVDREKNETHP